VSSANLSTLLQTDVSKSFINMRNRTGPKTEPCGTPLHTHSATKVHKSYTDRNITSFMHKRTTN